MRFLTALLGATVSLANIALAQSSLERLAEARAGYPICALGCMKKLIPQSDCTATDIECLCTNEELTLQTTGCVLKACTVYEGLQTKNVSMTMCGAPVRDKSAQPLFIGLVFGALALLAFILRIISVYSRNGRQMGWDDYTSIVTVLLAGPPTVFAVTLTNNGLGKDMWTLPLQNIKNVLEYYYLGEIFYFGSITANKLSILLFMLRVFPDYNFRKVVYIVCGVVVAYGLSFIFATTFQCWPVEYSWQQVDSNWGHGSCNNIHLQGWMSAIFNIVIDLIMLALPLKHLWALQMKMKKKIMIMVMFSLGIFVTAISVIRLQSLVRFANSDNITWDYTEAAWWSTLEIHVGIVCACLPSIRQLLASLGASILQSTKNKSSGSEGYSSSNPSALRSGKSNASAANGEDTLPSQHVPKRGDEGDFVPLVEYPEHRAFGKTSSYSIAESRAHTDDSV